MKIMTLFDKLLIVAASSFRNSRISNSGAY